MTGPGSFHIDPGSNSRPALSGATRGLLALILLAGLTGAARAEDVAAPSAPPQHHIASDGAAGTQFILDGLVMTPATYDHAALAALPQATVTVGNVTYTGVALWGLLNKADIVTHPDVKNDILREVVTATASDGYKVVISLGEIDPNFGNQPCLIALQQNGADFTSGGFAHLVFPNDVKRGRWVYNLTGLTVSENP